MSTKRPAGGKGGKGGKGGESVPRLIAEKIRILRMLRALDRAGIDPSEIPALQVPLVRVAEVDAMLASVLEVVDRLGEDEGLARQEIPALLQIAEEIRGSVVDALGRDDEEAYRRASGEVTASEAEIWMDVETVRRTSSRGTRPMSPLSDAEAAKAARQTWGRKKDLPVPGAARVRKEEQRALPPDDAPLEAWFERMPEPWLEGVARIHDVPLKDRDALAARVARRLTDPAWLRRFLSERVGASERDRLGWLVEGGSVPLDLIRRSGSNLDVHWDWTSGMPASPGGKLRAAGFVHVGTRAGTKFAVVPSGVRDVLREALFSVDPSAAKGPERAVRQSVAEALMEEPFQDEQLDYWKRLDKGLAEPFERWALQADGERTAAAVDALFAGTSRELRSPIEQTALLGFLLFDWREEPGAPSLAETRLVDEAFSSEDERALAAATIAAVPGIYRIGEIRRGLEIDLIPAFPEGPAVVLNDRSLSLTVESDWWIGARVYPAGPYVFGRILGDLVAPEAGKRMLGSLQRAFQRFVKAGGEDDVEAFLRTRLATLIRALRTYRG